jgi:hypothetical protein
MSLSLFCDICDVYCHSTAELPLGMVHECSEQSNKKRTYDQVQKERKPDQEQYYRLNQYNPPDPVPAIQTDSDADADGDEDGNERALRRWSRNQHYEALKWTRG